MKKFVALAMAGAVLTMTAGTVQAAPTLVINSISSVYTGNNSYTADISKTNNPQNYDYNVSISPQKIVGTLDGAAVTLFSYCADIFENSGTGTFSAVSVSSLFGTTKANQIAALISAHSAQSNALTDSAVQLAVWEILYETNATLGLGSGTFRASDIQDGYNWTNDSGVGTSAASMLADAADGSPINPQLNLYIAKNSGRQDMLFWTTSPVPEPATWGMMLLGLGAVGGALRSRRTTAKVSFS